MAVSHAETVDLPATAPPAPWTVQARALMWTGRANRRVVQTLPRRLRQGWRPVLTAVSLVSYSKTPVGPYEEVVAAVILLRGRHRIVHVPFIAVDSPTSVVGGRENWALPKTLARFEGAPMAGTTMSSRGDGFDIEAKARSLGPAFPARSTATLVQERPTGGLWQTALTISARVRPALITVTLSGSAQLEGWLPRGRFVGLVAERFEGTFAEPQEVP